MRPLAHIKKPLYKPFDTNLAPPFAAIKPCYDDSLDSELSSFEDEHMSQDEIARILALEQPNLLEHQLWLNQIKLKKWERALTKLQGLVKQDVYYTTKLKRDIYKQLTKQI